MNKSTVLNFNRTHIVEAGDTLPSIAQQYYHDQTFANDLAHVNGMSVNAILTAGTEIKVPHKSKLRHAVQRKLSGLGDTPLSDGDTLPTMSISTPPDPAWYANPTTWMAVAAGFVVAYFFFGKKSKN